MNLDMLLQLHTDVARNTVANSQVPPIERIVEVHNRRRVKAGIAITAITAAAVAVVLLLGGPASDLTSTTVAPAGGGPPGTVSGVEPFDSVLQEDPLVLRAELGPEPRFDTSNLGVEQPLVPVETLATSLQQVIAGDIFGGGILLAIDEVSAVGYLPGTTRNVLVANGKINEPNGPGFGEPAQCVSVSGPGRDPSITGDCHQILPATQVRPIAIGLRLFGVNWAGWSFLPEETSVTVLSVDGVDRFWQRPRGNITIFTIEATPETKLELRVLDSAGLEIARGDQTQPDEPTPPVVEPIGGYGDFSETAYEDVDWVQVVTLIVECMNDQGFAATIIPPGVGISYNNIPQDQHWAAGLAESACEAGLNLPEFPSSSELDAIIAEMDAFQAWEAGSIRPVIVLAYALESAGFEVRGQGERALFAYEVHGDLPGNAAVTILVGDAEVVVSIYTSSDWEKYSEAILSGANGLVTYNCGDVVLTAAAQPTDSQSVLDLELILEKTGAQSICEGPP